MKILFVNDHYSIEGGTEAYIQAVMSLLSQSGHEVKLVVGSGNTQGLKDVFLIPNLEPKGLARFLDENKFDIANIQTSEKPGVYDLLSSSLPTVRTLHDTANLCKMHFGTSEICSQPNSLKHCFYSAYTQGSMSRNPLTILENLTNRQSVIKNLVKVNRLLANSEFTKTSYIREGLLGETIEVIPMFPIVSPDKPTEKRKNNVIIFSGRIFREKGVDHLIRAFAKVKAGTELWIVGQGWDLGRCQKLAQELSIQESVKFLGFTQREKLKEFYAEAAIGAMPSLWGEPFGLSGIEMMSFGLPVVGYDSGATSEWLKNDQNGLLVDRGNIDQLAESLNLLLTDQARREKLGRNAREFVIQSYNTKTHLELLTRAYTEASDRFNKNQHE